jgi:hypothetical protein
MMLYNTHTGPCPANHIRPSHGGICDPSCLANTRQIRPSHSYPRGNPRTPPPRPLIPSPSGTAALTNPSAHIHPHRHPPRYLYFPRRQPACPNTRSLPLPLGVLVLGLSPGATTPQPHPRQPYPYPLATQQCYWPEELRGNTGKATPRARSRRMERLHRISTATLER